MTKLFSTEGMDVVQKDLQQVILRGKGDEQFAQVINKEISLLPPSDNLRVVNNDEFILAKQSFDQWCLISLKEKSHKEILKLVSIINANEEMLASDYSYGQVYFEIMGHNKNYYLNKLTHFDLRPKKFPVLTMAQTLVARIDCSIYHLQDKYIISCNSSFEDYFKDRFLDTISL